MVGGAEEGEVVSIALNVENDLIVVDDVVDGNAGLSLLVGLGFKLETPFFKFRKAVKGLFFTFRMSFFLLLFTLFSSSKRVFDLNLFGSNLRSFFLGSRFFRFLFLLVLFVGFGAFIGVRWFSFTAGRVCGRVLF